MRGWTQTIHLLSHQRGSKSYRWTSNVTFLIFAEVTFIFFDIRNLDSVLFLFQEESAFLPKTARSSTQFTLSPRSKVYSEI